MTHESDISLLTGFWNISLTTHRDLTHRIRSGWGQASLFSYIQDENLKLMIQRLKERILEMLELDEFVLRPQDVPCVLIEENNRLPTIMEILCFYI